jgi:predicted DNA-binding antitoxin AbrB/MazE fold protein
MDTVRAVFEDGVFRPIVPVQLPNHAQFDFEPRPVVAPQADESAPPEPFSYSEEGLRKVYEILGERYSSGYSDTAARHNEHQP